jgi:hypothetical protein
MKQETKIRFSVIAVLCALVFWTPPAKATVIRIEIEGVVDSIMDDGNYLEGEIKVGDSIGGFYVYESTTPDTNPSIYVGDYQHNVPPYGISLSVGGFEFKTNPANMDFNVEIINESTSGGLHDAYGVLSGSNLALSNGTIVDHISWWLGDSSATALSSIDLPTTAPVLSAWQSRNWLRLDGQRGLYIVDGHVTSAIPEPGTLLLLSLGGLFLRKRT